MSDKETATLSPLMRPQEKRTSAAKRLIGVISKARAREWIRHVNKTRQEWN